jgi:hypothetical protein
MSTRIDNLEFVFQHSVTQRATKNVVRRDSSEGPVAIRRVNVGVNILIGPDSGANAEMRRIVFETVKERVGKGELYFYVIARFRKQDDSTHFKTIIPRSEIPIQLRRL